MSTRKSYGEQASCKLCGTDNRIFCAVRPTGIVWADRMRVVDGDYARLAFLPYSTLELRFEPDCPPELAPDIKADAAFVQAKRGTNYRVSTSGQTVRLGAS